MSSVVGVGGSVSEVHGTAGGRSSSLVCGAGVVYVVVVVEDVVYVVDGALLDGVTRVPGGSDEPSDVRIIANTSTPINNTAAAPAANIVAGRLDQCSGSWSEAGTGEC